MKHLLLLHLLVLTGVTAANAHTITRVNAYSTLVPAYEAYAFVTLCSRATYVYSEDYERAKIAASAISAQVRAIDPNLDTDTPWQVALQRASA